MDNNFHSYLTEALFASVAHESLFEEDEEEEIGSGNKNTNITKRRKEQLASSNSFDSIAYIDDDSGPENSSKVIREKDIGDDKIDCNVLNDDNDNVFPSSTSSSPRRSTNSSEESFRTAFNTLTREEGIKYIPCGCVQ